MTLWRFSGAMHNIHQLLRPILPVPHFPATVTLQICSQREWFVTILDTKYVLQRTVLEHDVLVPYASDSYLTCYSPVQAESVWSLLKGVDQCSEIWM